MKNNKSTAYDKIVSITEQIVDKKLRMIDGAIKIHALQFEADPEYEDEDLITFVAIASETDDLPLGAERQYWQKEALAKKDIEIEKAEEWAQEYGIEACHRLVKRFKD